MNQDSFDLLGNPASKNKDDSFDESSRARVHVPKSPPCKFPDDFSSRKKVLSFPSIGCSPNLLLENQSLVETAVQKSEKKTKTTTFLEIPKPKLKLPVEIISNDFEGDESPCMKKEKKTKISKFISQLWLTKKFIRNLMNSTIYRKPKWLKSFHFQIINDWSFFGDRLVIQEKNNKFLGYFYEIIQKVKNKLLKKSTGVIHPTKLFHIIFDIISLIITIMCFIIIPIDMGFQIDVLDYEFIEHKAAKSIRTIILVFYFLDIFINFNTAFYYKGEMIKNRAAIIKDYMKHRFIQDNISIVYFYWSLFYDNYPYPYWFQQISGLFFLLRFQNISAIIRRIEEFLFIDEKFYNYLLFFKLVFRILILSHFFACFWHFIGNNTTNSWIEIKNLSSEPWLERYLYSLYYIAVTMNTVGFGDISSNNNYETIFTILFIYFACGLFGYTLNSIGIILQNIQKNETEFKRNMNILNGYMKQKKIHLSLRTKIHNYLEYASKEDHLSNEKDALEIMNRLSPALKSELLLHANGVLLKHLKIFNNNFSDLSLKKLVYLMKEMKLIPGEIIYKQNDVNDPNIYIIKKGKVELYVETPREETGVTILQTLKKNEYFGELSFFTDEPKETSARSSTFTSLYVINREKFIEIIKENYLDYENFCKIKDEIKLYNNYNALYFRCLSCKEVTHPTASCPFLHLCLSNQRILQKYNYSIFQERKKFARTKPKRKKIANVKLIRKDISELNESSSYNNLNNESSLNGHPKDTLNSFKNIIDNNQMKIENENENEKEDFFIVESNDENLLGFKKRLRQRSKSLPLSLSRVPIIKLNNNEVHEEKFILNKEKVQTSSKNMNSLSSFNLNKDCDKSKSSFSKIANARNNTDLPNKTFSTINNNLETQTILPSFEETMKSYEFYFPHNNSENTVAECNRIIYMNLKKKRLHRFRNIRKSWRETNPEISKGDCSPAISSLLRKSLASPSRNEKSFFNKIESQNSKSFSKFKMKEFLEENDLVKKKKKKTRKFFFNSKKK